jgi:hypothetical protein
MGADIFEARCEALRAAVAHNSGIAWPQNPDEVLRTAGKFLRWLVAPTTRLRVRVSPETGSVTQPGTFRPTTYTPIDGGLAMAVTMQDNEYVTLTADPLDAEGNPTADSGLTWAADNTALVTLTPSADGTQVNVGAAADGGLGTANISLTDAAGNVSPADPITITSGPATQVGIAAGTPAVIPDGGVPVPAGTSAPSGS